MKYPVYKLLNYEIRGKNEKNSLPRPNEKITILIARNNTAPHFNWLTFRRQYEKYRVFAIYFSIAHAIYQCI